MGRRYEAELRATVPVVVPDIGVVHLGAVVTALVRRSSSRVRYGHRCGLLNPHRLRHVRRIHGRALTRPSRGGDHADRDEHSATTMSALAPPTIGASGAFRRDSSMWLMALPGVYATRARWDGVSTGLRIVFDCAEPVRPPRRPRDRDRLGGQLRRVVRRRWRLLLQPCS